MALGRKSKNIRQRNWRPDFRDVNTLPDTKVVRTGFLLNFVAIALALGVMTLYVVKEYSLQSVSRSVSNLEQQVAENTERNRKILDENKAFTQSSNIVSEVIAFDHQEIDYAEFVMELSGIRSESILLSSIRLGGSSAGGGNDRDGPFMIELKGRIGGTATQTPSQIISTFQEAISGLTTLSGKTLKMDLIRFNRNNELGHFDFTLQVNVTPEGEA